MRYLVRALCIMALLAYIPASAPANSAFPQVECSYQQGLDRIVQMWLTDAEAYHLAPELESMTPRIITPDELMSFHGVSHNPLDHCDILRNADSVDVPFTMQELWNDHVNHQHYIERHQIRPTAF